MEMSFLETGGGWITVLSQSLYVRELHVKAGTVPLQQVHSVWPKRKIIENESLHMLQTLAGEQDKIGVPHQAYFQEIQC
jgi:hypothetical protein